MPTSNKITLFEYDTPIDRALLLNYQAGIWFWTIQNTYAGFTDDYSVTGYYEYQQSVLYNVKSFKANGVDHSKVNSLADCVSTDSSFYYDSTTSNLYIHFKDFGVPTINMFYGAATGYSKMPNNSVEPYYNGFYYEPCLTSVFGFKKSIDPLFFGLLKYQSGSVNLINSSGEFDDWRSRNLYGQAARILVGNTTDSYSDFDTVFEGFISDDSRTFDSFTVKLEDARRSLTQPIATNRLTQTEYPFLNDNNVDAVKPVVYGIVRNAKAICLNEDETTPTYYEFLICDTEYNSVSALTKIYVDGTETAITGTANLTAGTFTMTSASVTGNLTNVTITFTASSIVNGASIIKDLMLNYDGKTYISSFWDTTEVAAAVTDSRNTSVYVDSGSTKLSDVIQDVCNDIDARFFVKNNGLYTIRLYDVNRTPNTKLIYSDEWSNYPTIENNASEYLSGAIIEYSQDIDNNESLLYEETSYKDAVFAIYKKYKVQTFKTNLTTLADAVEKADTIMNISKEVQDIVNRNTYWDNFGIEPTDFITCSPVNRDSEDVENNIYEVMSIKNNVNNFDIELSLRYVKGV